MTQHTPGPWAVEIPFQEKGLYVTAANPRKTNPLICRLSPLEEQEANARLIAAAPQMLEALRLVLAESAKRTSHTVLSAKAHAAVNAAIESARGPVTLPEEAR